MSLKAMSWAFDQQLTPEQKIVLLALADYADGDGVCFPGQKNLARKTSIPERTLRRRIQELEELKLIIRRRRHHGDGYRTSDEYRLLPAGVAGWPTGQEEAPQRPTVAGTEEPSVEPSVTATARARQLPSDLTWTNAHSLKAHAKGVDVEAEFEKFKDYHLARASKFVDWDRAFHTWLNNARPDPVARQRTDAPARRTPTDRMNDVLAIQDPREQRQIDG